jgi:hypothetical protein
MSGAGNRPAEREGLRAVVSAKANAHERSWRKVRLLTEPARQYGRLKY